MARDGGRVVGADERVGVGRVAHHQHLGVRSSSLDDFELMEIKSRKTFRIINFCYKQNLPK